MHTLKKLSIAYLVIIHAFATLYAYNVLRVFPPLTFLFVSIFSLILILASALTYIDKVLIGKKSGKMQHVIFFFVFIIPITIFYYLPLFYSYNIIKLISYVFPSIAQYLLWLSYNPTYILFIYPQLIIAIFSTFFSYFYSERTKK
jgi:hypothetical protein